MQTLPIGLFDSGVGGLTVLKACQELLPQETFIYLGDTARLPYGTKGPETICQYATQMTEILLQRGIKALVIACNTASALALPSLQKQFPELPILGVLQPGAQAALRATKVKKIAVIATEATIKAEGYHKAITTADPSVQVVAQACGLFVALAEEGWADNPITTLVAQEYIAPLFASEPRPDTLLLGCTHFPILTQAIRNVVGEQVQIVDSAHATAYALQALLEEHKLFADQQRNGVNKHFLVTDLPRRFQRMAHYFLAEEIAIDDIELVDSHR